MSVSTMNNRAVVIAAVAVGLLLVVLAIVYFITPAKQLPSFFPGYDPTLVRVHYKHGIGVLILGLAAFALAWFQSGKKSAQQ